jgi:hypothetical protein
VKVVTKPATRSPAPTPHPAHILVPIRGLAKPRMECPDGKVVDETVAYWKVVSASDRSWAQSWSAETSV